MTLTFETLQKNLQNLLKDSKVKGGSKKGAVIECVYMIAMRDAGVSVPLAAEMMLLTGRSIAEYKSDK